MEETTSSVGFQVAVGGTLLPTLAESYVTGAVYVESETEIAINGQGMPLDVFGKLVTAVAEIAGPGATFRNAHRSDGLGPGVWNIITKGEYAEPHGVDPEVLTPEGLSELGDIQTVERTDDGVTVTLKLPTPLAKILMQELECTDGQAPLAQELEGFDGQA